MLAYTSMFRNLDPSYRIFIVITFSRIGQLHILKLLVPSDITRIILTSFLYSNLSTIFNPSFSPQFYHSTSYANSHMFSLFTLRPLTGYRFSSFNFIIIFPPSSFYSFGYQSVIQQPPLPTYLRWRFCISAFLSRGIRPSFFHLIIIPSLPPLCEFLRSSSVRDLFTPVILWCARALWKRPLGPSSFLPVPLLSRYQLASSPFVILTPLPAAFPCLRAISLYLDWRAVSADNRPFFTLSFSTTFLHKEGTCRPDNERPWRERR